MYTMKLADGTLVIFEGINGTNFITPDKTPIDTSIFTNTNLASGVMIDPDGGEEAFEDWAFIQQQKQLNGDYYISFRQRTDEELAEEARSSYITTLEEALVELYELML